MRFKLCHLAIPFRRPRGVLGKTIRSIASLTPSLVLPRVNFHGTEVFYWPEVWVPMMMQAQIEPGNAWLDNPGSFNTWVIGRLKPGITSAQATGNLNTIAHSLALKNPTENEGIKFNLSQPGLMGNVFGGPVRAFSFGVLTLAGLVLLTACANLASMVTARGADRQREVAIRLSVGATRWRVQRQALTETVVLGLAWRHCRIGVGALLATTCSAPGVRRWIFRCSLTCSLTGASFFLRLSFQLITGVLFGLAPARSAVQN